MSIWFAYFRWMKKMIKVIIKEEDFNVEMFYNCSENRGITRTWNNKDAESPSKIISNLCEQIEKVVVDYRKKKGRWF